MKGNLCGGSLSSYPQVTITTWFIFRTPVLILAQCSQKRTSTGQHP
jgi:hypothetical protein